MKARYFYDKMLECMEDTKNNGRYHHNYSSGMIQIHHKGNESEYFWVFCNGDVRKYPDILSSDRIDMRIEDLDSMGDDFELFNTFQVLKAGYLIIDDIDENKDKNLMKKVIYKLLSRITFEDNTIFESLRPRTKSNPDPRKETCNKFSYVSNESIRVDIKLIDELCGLNKKRAKDDLKPIPFNKSMSRTNAIHVSFAGDLRMRDKKDQLQLCQMAVEELLGLLKDSGISGKFRECKMGASPVYY